MAVAQSGSLTEKCYAVPDVFTKTYNTGGIAAYGYTGTTIQNNAVLAGTLETTEQSNIARITGRLNVDPTFSNNVASENVLVQGAKITEGTAADNEQGLTVTDEQLRSQELYQNTLGWDFESVWTMDEEQGRPVLQSFLNPVGPEPEDLEPVEPDPTEETIATAADLEKIRSNPAGDYILTEDIRLEGEFTPISNFSGTLDGQGHTIIGLKITAGDQQKTGFFAENSGTIRNLGFSDVTVRGISSNADCWAAGIVADNNGIIEQCYVTGSVTGGYRSAGIAAHSSGMIRNCYAIIRASANDECAGIVAVAERNSVTENCYTVPDLSTVGSNTGGIAAYGYGANDTGAATIIRNNAVLAGSITNGNGENIARITGRLNGDPTFSNNVASENVLVRGEQITGGTLDNNQGLTVTDEELKSQELYQNTLGWNFDSVWDISSELGRPVLKNVPEIVTEVEPVDGTIATAADLEKLRENPEEDYTLTANIHLDENFTPIDYFAGTLNGQGHTISGLTIRDDSTNQIGFIVENRGTIRNLGFSNVALQGDVSDGGCYLAGIAVRNYGTIEQCYVNGKIYGGHRAAGITTHNYGTVRNCYTQVKVKANWECGAIVSVSEAGSVIESCYVIPNVFSYAQNTGGISSYGRSDSVIRNSAVLSGAVENGNKTTAARIMGKLKGSPEFENNVASENALVQGQKVTGGTADNEQGLTVTEAQLKNQSLYDETLGWDFEAVWTWDDGLARPVLRGLEEDPMVDVVDIRDISLNVGSDQTMRNLNWLSTSTMDGVAQVALASQYQEGQAFPAENVKEFKAERTDIGMDEFSNKVEISGLEPNTRYVYRVGNEELWSEVHSFTTGAMSGDFNFLFAGDPQIGSSGNVGNDGKNWEQTLDYAVEWFPESSFLLSAGDQVEHHSNDGEYESFLAPDVLTSLPLATNIGNHDVGSKFYEYRFNMPNVSEDYGLSGNDSNSGGDYWFIYNNTLFISLNSNNLSTASHEAFIDSVLREHGQGVDWKVVTFHHSVYSAASHNQDSDILQRREELPRIFSQYDIDVVLMGHDHAYTRSKMMNGTDVAADQDHTDPAAGDVLYITANSASGSKYYALQNGGNFIYSEVSRQDSRPTIANIEVTDNTFTISTYFTDDASETLMDTVTLTKNQDGDHEAPTILVPVDDIVTQGTEFDPMDGVDVIDNVDDGLESSMKVEGTVDTETQGVYTLTYTVSDKAGNTATAVRVVTVSVSTIIDDLQEDTVTEIVDGVELRKMVFEDTDGSRQVANVIDVDMENSGAEIIVGTKDDKLPQADENGDMIPNSLVGAPVTEQAATTEKVGKDVVAGVNGEFYVSGGIPEGYLIKDGGPVINGVMVPGVNDRNYPTRAFFGVRKDGSVLIGDYGEDWEREKDNLVQASGGQFWMVKDGVVQDFSDLVITDPNDPNYDEEVEYRHGTHPRTAVGIREDGSVFFVVVDGRGMDGAEGFTIEKLGQYMKDLGAYQALNMDGGGSSTAVTLNRETGEYEVQNTPSDGQERSVCSSLLVLVPEPTLKLNLSEGALQGVTAHNFEDGTTAVIARYNAEGTRLLDKRIITVTDAGENEEGKYYELDPMAYEQGDQFRLYAWNSTEDMLSGMAPQAVTFEDTAELGGDIVLNQVDYEEAEHTFPLEAVTGDEYFLNEQSAYSSAAVSRIQRQLRFSCQYDDESSTYSGTVSLTEPEAGVQTTLAVVKKDADMSNLKEDDLYYISEIPTDTNGQVKFSIIMDADPEDYRLVVSAPAAEQKSFELRETPETDKTALDAEIKTAQGLSKGDYTEETWKIFEQALSEALKVQQNPDAVQSEIDACLENLRKARLGLIKAGEETKPEETTPEETKPEETTPEETTPEETKPEETTPEETTPEETKPDESRPDGTSDQKPEGNTEKPAGTGNSPETGDKGPAVWIFLAITGLAALAATECSRRLKERKDR